MTEGIFLITILLVLTVFFLFSLSRITARRRKERERSQKKGGSQVEFVVDTFHELVAKLKEKEKELDALRKEAEERASVIENYNEYILQSVPSGVISLDKNNLITKVNSAAEKILSLKAEDVLGRKYEEIFGEPFRSILGGGATVERAEFQYTAGSGENIHIGLTLTPLLNADRETIGRLIVFTDLTALKALEAQADLRDRLSSLGEMAAGMAHELRNPMGVIAGYTKMLSKKADPSLMHVVDSISKEVSAMDRIITDFLSFARPTELNIDSVDLEQLIKTCVANIAGDRKEIKTYFDLAGVPSVRADEILLRQAFINLVQNAVEAMPHGGDLRFRFAIEPNNVEITVSDSGYGIPEKIKDRIFLPFYTTKDKGTGLGLAIAHKIIVSHNGSISAESSEKGTTFRVKLPL